MSKEVKRYEAVHIRYGEGCEVEVVTAADYDALLAERDALKKDREARDWEMKAKGVMNVIHLVVSKSDQDVLRRYANDMLDEAKQLDAPQGEH